MFEKMPSFLIMKLRIEHDQPTMQLHLPEKLTRIKCIVGERVRITAFVNVFRGGCEEGQTFE